ncbi:MAG: CBS domain-containing protein [Deltaproteobacteria bacterium]|nr:CBS domain-containing protein [Deltaproteobacteria bacterium]
MAIHNWREELKLSQQKLESVKSRAAKELNKPIRSLQTKPIASIRPATTLRTAASEFIDFDVEHALVQETPDTFVGVLRREAVHAAIVAAGKETPSVTVVTIMDRNICVEPDSATIGEVLNRMAWGGCTCAVLVNSEGEPSGIISPSIILDHVNELINEEPQSFQIAMNG